MDLRNGFDIKRYIRTIPDYPKPGIMFRDITTLLADLHAFRAAVDELAWPFLKADIDYVAGIEARGFILGGAVAHALGRGFIPIRKKGKLPSRGDRPGIRPRIRRRHHRDSCRRHQARATAYCSIDDLIATGGTAGAAIDLIRKSGGEVVAAAFVIDLPDLGGAAKLRAKGVKVHTLVSFEGH